MTSATAGGHGCRCVWAWARVTAWDIQMLGVSSSDEEPEAALWDTSHRQAAPLLATHLSAWDQTA